jgi:hypothetical protein
MQHHLFLREYFGLFYFKKSFGQKSYIMEERRWEQGIWMKKEKRSKNITHSLTIAILKKPQKQPPSSGMPERLRSARAARVMFIII